MYLQDEANNVLIPDRYTVLMVIRESPEKILYLASLFQPAMDIDEINRIIASAGYEHHPEHAYLVEQVQHTFLLSEIFTFFRYFRLHFETVLEILIKPARLKLSNISPQTENELDEEVDEQHSTFQFEMDDDAPPMEVWGEEL